MRTHQGRNGELKTLSVKIPLATWEAIQAYALACGQDVSAVANWMLADGMPVLKKRHADLDMRHRLARAQGVAEAVSDRLAEIRVEDGPDAAGDCAAEVLRRLGSEQSGRRAA